MPIRAETRSENQQLKADRYEDYTWMGLAAELGSRFKAAFAAEIIGIIAGGILIIILARLLGPNSYGLLFLSISVFSVAKLFSAFGIAKSASRYIAEYKETDPGQIPHILRVSFALNLLTIGLIALLFIAGRDFIATLIGEPELPPFLLLGSAFIVFSTIELFIRQTLQGFENIKAASAVSALQKTSRLCFVVGFVLLGFGAIGALAGYIVSYAFVVIIGGGYLIHQGYQSLEPSQIDSNLKRRIAEYSIPIAVTQSAHTIDHHLDKVLIGFFIGPVAVAYYTIGKQIVQFIETPMSALGFTLSPMYGSQKAKGNVDTAARIYETALSQGLLVYMAAAAGVMILAEPGIKYVFGQDYLGAVPVLQILAIFAVLKSIAKLTSHGLDYLGRARDRAIVRAITAISNVILNIILIPSIGVVGAAIATVVSFGVYVIFSVYIMHVELSLRIRWILKRTTFAAGIAFLMSVVVLLSIQFISGVFTLIAVVCLGAVTWTILSVISGMIDINNILFILRTE